jgi:hypothetical protein
MCLLYMSAATMLAQDARTVEVLAAPLQQTRYRASITHDQMVSVVSSMNRRKYSIMEREVLGDP